MATRTDKTQYHITIKWCSPRDTNVPFANICAYKRTIIRCYVFYHPTCEFSVVLPNRRTIFCQWSDSPCHIMSPSILETPLMLSKLVSGLEVSEIKSDFFSRTCCFICFICYAALEYCMHMYNIYPYLWFKECFFKIITHLETGLGNVPCLQVDDCRYIVDYLV